MVHAASTVGPVHVAQAAKRACRWWADTAKGLQQQAAAAAAAGALGNVAASAAGRGRGGPEEPLTVWSWNVQGTWVTLLSARTMLAFSEVAISFTEVRMRRTHRRLVLVTAVEVVLVDEGVLEVYAAVLLVLLVLLLEGELLEGELLEGELLEGELLEGELLERELLEGELVVAVVVLGVLLAVVAV